MNATVVGLLTGLTLGFAGYFGGFGAFLVVAAMGLVGLIVGHLARGDVHVSDYVRKREDDGRRETFDRPRSTYSPGPPRAGHAGRVR
ncbi:hypothetical protein GCM10012285_07000 [Streptomyces kronopolitis]|uniref:DUF2273 domain-containing protein n=1 Tax=Streptomyces kronopolitis TaxID=1612435 RepID=A0ABQ2IZI9_9ACTN|nr:hypothetical protein [Streptomyces kronopolitis]GGN34672.1 hypothetical protein GCM10012285_07000 [Streptomyces kronopolitis]